MNLLTARFDHAIRWASAGHRDQVRRGSGVPYVQHVVAVAWVLERLGFEEDVVIAGLLHDLVEDTDTTLDQVLDRFGPKVSELVGYCSEVKLDSEGKTRPWIDRKRDHLAALALAPIEARAIVLADKLHNLLSIRQDLDEGRPVWDQFHASRDQVLWYYRATLAVCQAEPGDARLARLVNDCQQILNTLTDSSEGDSENLSGLSQTG